MIGVQRGGYIQKGGGDFPVFRGSRYQRGYGIGSLLSSVLRTAIPLVKKAGKVIGKQALKTSLDIGQDLMDGKNFRQSAKQRGLQSARNLTQKTINRLSNGSQTIKRKKRKTVNVSSNKQRKTKSGPFKKRVTKKRRITSSAKRGERPHDIFDR